MRDQPSFTAGDSPGETQLVLHVRDERGDPLAARVVLRDQNGIPLNGIPDHYADTLLPGRRIDGTARIPLHPGTVDMEIWCGFERIPLCGTIRVRHRKTVTVNACLPRRMNMAEHGWYCGDSHCHVMHGERATRTCTMEAAALAGRAEGLHYLHLAPHWDASRTAYDATVLNRLCKRLSTDTCTIMWNLEAPKSYLPAQESGNIGCHGHGYTIGLKDYDETTTRSAEGPAYLIHEDIHRRGGICAITHPARWWMEEGRFVSNMAQELPFDTVAGPTYDAIDVFSDAPHLFWQSEQLWFALLNMGYRMPGLASSDAALDTNNAFGFMRTYSHIKGGFAFAGLKTAITHGHSFMTTGPLVFFSIDDKPVGTQFVADNTTRTVTIRAFSSPHPDDRIEVVHVIKDGVVVKAFSPLASEAREWSTSFGLRESDRAWYCVRVVCSTHQRPLQEKWGPGLKHYAITNPFYFLKPGERRPTPAKAKVTIAIASKTKGRSAKAVVHTEHNNRRIATTEITRSAVFRVPATAGFVIERDGHPPVSIRVFEASGAAALTREMNMLTPSLYSPEIYREIRRLLADVNITLSG